MKIDEDGESILSRLYNLVYEPKILNKNYTTSDYVKKIPKTFPKKGLQSFTPLITIVVVYLLVGFVKDL